MRVYNISAQQSFLDRLTKYILDKYSNSSLSSFSITKIKIFLPNRRTCRYLKQSFLKQNKNRAVFLPKIVALSDIDDFVENEYLEDLPDSISDIKRHLTITKLIQDWQKKENKDFISLENSSFLALKFIHFLDESLNEKLDFNNLEKIVPEDLANHWQISLDFLSEIKKEYDLFLLKNSLIDKIDRQIIAIDLFITKLKNSKTEEPIFIAGSTASNNITLNFIKKLHEVRNVNLVLPNLDRTIAKENWKNIPESHPQFNLKNLLNEISVERCKVEDIENECEIKRKIFLSECLKDNIKINYDHINAKCIKNLKLIETDTDYEEITTISLIIRKYIEEDKKVAVITANENFANNVGECIKKWDILADNTFGTTIFNTKIGSLVFLLFEFLKQENNPDILLSILKHSLVKIEESNIIKLEKETLRKIYFYNEFNEIYSYNKASLEHFKDCINNLLEFYKKNNFINFSHLFGKVVEAANQLCNGNLFENEEGEQLKDFFDNVISENKDFFIHKKTINQTIKNIFITKKYHPKFKQSHNLFIFNPMEARLLDFDVVILSNLNENIWSKKKINPWMNRLMRSEFGLPNDEKHSGIVAHDFQTFACKKHVYLTRSRKSNGTENITYSYLQRIITVLKNRSLLKHLKSEIDFLSYAKILQKPDHYFSINLPTPSPKEDKQQNYFSVTEVESLIRNPYAIFAKKILGLKKIEEKNRTPNEADFGNILHSILENHSKNQKNNLEKELAKLPTNIRIIWREKIERILKDFFDFEKKYINERNIQKTLAEEPISAQINLSNNKKIILKGKIDRIDLTKNSIYISDYKTGRIAEKKDLEAFITNQLGILDFICAKNNILDSKLKETKTSYIKLHKEGISEKNVTKIKNVECENNLKKLFKLFLEDNLSYLFTPNPKVIGKNNDYNHLSRIEEIY